MTVPEGGDWYTDDSMKLIEQETYTLEDAHWLNITSKSVKNPVQITGLNTRNCVDGMIVGQVSWVLDHTVACTYLDDKTYEFIISWYSMNNDYKGINDLFRDSDVAPYNMIIHMNGQA